MPTCRRHNLRRGPRSRLRRSRSGQRRLRRPPQAEKPTTATPSVAPPRPSSPPRIKRRRRPVPFALKAIAGLVVVAVAFIVAAILGGSGSTSSNPLPGAAAPVGGNARMGGSPTGQTATQLGYPAFATNNTTRIGGADPTSNAAAVALATFPSTTSAQRPAAVALVGEDDWQGAIAASVLMAAPVKAPVLISAQGGVPEPDLRRPHRPRSPRQRRHRWRPGVRDRRQWRRPPGWPR